MNKSQELVKKLFKDSYGKSFEMTDSQIELFDLIFKKQYPRNHIMTYTQYGKSDITSMAVLTRVSTFPEQFAIVAPTDPKTKIIMSFIIQHIFDNPYTLARLKIEEGESLERLRRERSKNKLVFKVEGGYGEVFVLSAQATRVSDVINALMGYGCIQKGFKVLTDIGEIEISKLVDKKETGKVYSYNHKKNKIELQNIIEYQKNKLAGRDLIEIDLGDRKIVCTEDHPVWIIGKGYVKAKDLSIGNKCGIWVD